LKIEAVLPPDLRERSRRTRIYAPELENRIEASGMIDRLHGAVEARQVLQLQYRDPSARETARQVEPLCLTFWGGSWTLGAWCRLRQDFRNFRPDRIVAVETTGEIFTDIAGRDLNAYLRAVGNPHGDER
jgi:predicted DNA-binding transcriptional regulator YafY